MVTKDFKHKLYKLQVNLGSSNIYSLASHASSSEIQTPEFFVSDAWY